MASYNKADLIIDVAVRAGISKSVAESAITALFDTVVSRTKEGSEVSWPEFGSFSVSERSAGNLQTGAETQIPATRVMNFTAAKALQDDLNDS